MYLKETTKIADNVLLGRTADGARVFVTVDVTEMEGTMMSVDHKPVERWTRISFQGEVIEKGHRNVYECGQIVSRLAEVRDFAPGWDLIKLLRLQLLWQRHHLNDMRPGCIHQSPVGDDMSERLDNTPPCPETGYKWGSAWLVLPEEDTQAAIVQLRALFSEES